MLVNVTNSKFRTLQFVRKLYTIINSVWYPTIWKSEISQKESYRIFKQREQNNKYSFEWMKLNAPWWRHKRLFTPIYKTPLSTLFALADWKYIHFVNYYFVNLFSVPALSHSLNKPVHRSVRVTKWKWKIIVFVKLQPLT